MKLIHSQCGGVVVANRGARAEILENSPRPGATGSDMMISCRCSTCGETLGVLANVDTEEDARSYRTRPFENRAGNMVTQ